MKAGWTTKQLEAVLQKTENVNPTLKPKQTFKYVDVSSISNQSFEIVSTQELLGAEAPSRARKLIRLNDILFATIRPTLQRVAIVPDELDGQVCSTGYFVLRPQPEVDHRFLFYWLFTDDFMQQMETLQKGASYPAVTDGEVKSQPISFPAMAEQQRIVAILDEAFDGIATAKANANAEKSLQNARVLLESSLEESFAQLLKAWPSKRLDDLCERVSVGHVGPTTEFNCDASEGVTFLRSQNVRPGRLDLEGARFITRDFHAQLKKSQLRSGDLLFVRVGANRGDCCSVPEDIGELNCANIVFARPQGEITPFLECYCQSAQGQRQLLGMTTGSAQGVINTSSVAELVVPFPPANERKSVVESIRRLQDETERLESLYQQKLVALDELKKSLLHKAFSGNL